MKFKAIYPKQNPEQLWDGFMTAYSVTTGRFRMTMICKRKGDGMTMFGHHEEDTKKRDAFFGLVNKKRDAFFGLVNAFFKYDADDLIDDWGDTEFVYSPSIIIPTKVSQQHFDTYRHCRMPFYFNVYDGYPVEVYGPGFCRCQGMAMSPGDPPLGSLAPVAYRIRVYPKPQRISKT